MDGQTDRRMERLKDGGTEKVRDGEGERCSEKQTEKWKD